VPDSIPYCEGEIWSFTPRKGQILEVFGKTHDDKENVLTNDEISNREMENISI